ncbi:hypothetical protein ABPG72_022244 [Tetrahymena utriculariae]
MIQYLQDQDSQTRRKFKSDTKSKLIKQEYHQKINKTQHLQQFDINQCELDITSTRNYQSLIPLENEENYVSGRDLNDICVQIGRNQQDCEVRKSEMHIMYDIQPLNSTIFPKINLFEKQKENQKMEFNQEQCDRSFLKKKIQPFIEQNICDLVSFDNIDNKDQSNQFDPNPIGCKQNKISKTILQRRRSSKLQIEQLQNTLSKMIQAKNKIQKDEQEPEIMEQFELEDVSKSLYDQSILKSQYQKSFEADLQTKIDTKKQLKKKEEKISNVFVARLGIFQRFLRNMKNLSQSYKFRNMTEEQIQIINDASFFYSRNKQTNLGTNQYTIVLFRVFTKIFSKLINLIPVLNPLNLMTIGLEIAVLATLIIQIYFIPLSTSFDICNLKQGTCQITFYFIPAFFLLINMLVKLNTGFFKGQIIVNDRKQIITNYCLKGEFFLDLTTVLSFLVTQDFYVYLFLLVKLYQAYNSIQKIDAKFTLSQRFPFSFQIGQLIFLILMLAHINGCIFNSVAKDKDNSWLTKNQLQNADWYERYINSVYFSFITMVTVGYGDITPISLIEKVFVIFMVVYSCGVFGYVVSSIGNIFTERTQIQANYKRQLVDIINYMRTRNIDQMIQSQVFQYLHYLDQMDHYNHQKGEQILQKLSPHLQRQININSYFPFLQKTNYFKLNFKESTLISASLQMKEITFGPGQIIFNQNDCDNRLYYILKGQVQLSSNSHSICIKDEQDNCFGITEFFTGEGRNLQAKSLTVTQIIYLEMFKFNQVLKEDYLEYEKFCSLRDQIIYSKISIDQSCYFCNKFSHVYEQCPQYSIKNQKLLIIERSKKSINQVRQKFERFDRQKFSSIEENEDVRLNLKAVRLNYINNLNFNKDEIIKLIENNNQVEEDIDFYRFNDAFQLKCNEEGQSLDIKLISSDTIAEEFFLDEECVEVNQESNLNNNPANESYKNIFRTSMQRTDSQSEESKDCYQAPLIYSHNQLQRKTSILQNQNQEQYNGSQQNLQIDINDRHYQKNNKIQHIYRQKTKQKTILQQNYQNQNINEPSHQAQHQELYNQMVNFFEKMNERQQTENLTDTQTHIYKDEFFGIRNFDQMQEFTRYFPKSNYNSILVKLTRISQKRKETQLKKGKKPQLKCKSAICKPPSLAKNTIMSTLKAVKCIARLQKKSWFLDQKQLNSEDNQNAITITDRSTGVQNITMDLKSDNILLNNKNNNVPKSTFLSPFV